jgi:6-phosphogluconolactonase
VSAGPPRPLRQEIFATPADAARAAASHVAALLRAAARERGSCLAAVSGGRSPGAMFRALAREEVPWEQLHLFQVDERDAPNGHPDRNWTGLCADLLAHVALRPDRLHPIPVGSGGDLDDTAREYAGELESLAGRPPVLDLIHLGLGEDGHTASLAPGDPVLLVRDAAVAATRPYRGRRRITLTYPTLDAARRVLWLVLGEEKREALRRLREGDRSVPAARVAREHAILICDAAASGGQA